MRIRRVRIPIKRLFDKPIYSRLAHCPNDSGIVPIIKIYYYYYYYSINYLPVKIFLDKPRSRKEVQRPIPSGRGPKIDYYHK